MNEITLTGCTPTPLASYLKALGVLRLLGAKHSRTRGFWCNDRFTLRTSLDRQGIEHFFLEEYEPTPLVAPWGARSGFYAGSAERTAREALSRIEESGNARLGSFREMVEFVRDVLKRHQISQKASDEKKLDLLRVCRNELPDRLVEWLDTCYVLTGEDRRFPPLLGTGGNEGSGSYVSGFAQQIVACVVDEAHKQALSAALFGSTIPDSSVDQTPGHFSPADSGGPNASPGFEDSKSRTNPWDYILTLEGTVVLAGAAVRRLANDSTSSTSYPFTVLTTLAGMGSLAESDADKPRGEMWLPIWRRPSTYQEIRFLMAEGRVVLGRKPAMDGLDFVRALHRFGGYRGIQAFQRYGILKRNGGRSYFAVPLARVDASSEPRARWIDDLDRDQWLDRFRQFARGDKVASRFRLLRKRLEDMLFALSGREPSRAEAQALLSLLGEIQSALAKSPAAREAVRPIPRLSEQWVVSANDDSTAFRITKALAGLRGVGDQPLPLRAQLWPIERKRNRWITAKSDERLRICTGERGRLIDTLRMLLEKRLWLAEMLGMHDKPWDGPAGATLEDAEAFLHDDSMDQRIAALLPGLALCDIPNDVEHTAGVGTIPAAFALLKLCLTPDRVLDRLALLADGQQVPVPAGMLAQLAAGNHDNRALKVAWRRLRSSGLASKFAPDALPARESIDSLRACAALMVPLRFGATAALARSVLKQSEVEPV